MVGGQPGNLNIGAIIQARMQSSRLPGKILMPLPFDSNKPLLLWPIQELKKSNLINKIILATSDQPENNILNEFADQAGIYFFAGSENNVLSRFTDACVLHGLDVGIRITGDNPIIDIDLMDEIIALHIRDNNDYTNSLNLPIGMNIEVFNPKALLSISQKQDLTSEEKEHVTLCFKRIDSFKVFSHSFSGDILLNKIRITVDYPMDYAVLNLVAQIAVGTGLSGMKLIHYINTSYPWVWNINESIFQKKQFRSLEEELPYAIDLLKNSDLKFSQSILTKMAGEKSNA
jgi:spore coat polysaccharide biosynthesis protein SpsF